MTGETVLISARTQTGTDRYGKPVYGWAPSVSVNGCAVAPRGSAEGPQVGRQQVITGVSVYLPGQPQVGPYDRLTIRGVVYEVEGEPGDWRSPYSGRRGTEVAASRVEG